MENNFEKIIKNDYNADQIQVLDHLSGIRAKLGMYIGGTDNDAVHHIIKEILSNSIDEYLAGYGKTIRIIVNKKNNSVTIRDYGRGIPSEKIIDVFTKMHSSGKFQKGEGAAYGASGGLNGVGLKTSTATGLASVKVFRDGKEYSCAFTYKTIEPLKTTSNKTEKTGTEVTWIPDDEVFTDKTINLDKIESLVEDLSYLTPGLEFILSHEGEKETKIKAKSIEDFISDYVAQNDQISPIMSFRKGDNNLLIEGAMVWTKKTNLEQTYMNLIPTSNGGTHLTAAKTTLTKSANKLLNYTWTGEELRRGWVIILSVKSVEEVVFKGQDKSSVNMPSINAPLSALIREEFERLIEQNRAFFEKFKDMTEKIRKRDNTESLLKELVSKPKKNSLSDLTKKYKGCSAQTGIELFLAEGDSAGGGIAMSKSPINQAVFYLRGKPLNTFETDLEKVLKNEEIKKIIELLGSEENALKVYDKVILATDKDTDGAAIVNLMLGFFATFYPQLILKGKIYVPDMPLYVATSPSGEQKFFSDDKLVETFSKNWVISRFKGLGQMDPKLLSQFTTDTKTRKLDVVKVDPEDFESFTGALALALSKEKEQLNARRELFVD